VPEGRPAWCPGLVRGWYRYAHGWSASVQYSVGPGYTRLATFPAEHVRQAEPPSDGAPHSP
jgi:hypothetical protein